MLVIEFFLKSFTTSSIPYYASVTSRKKAIARIFSKARNFLQFYFIFKSRRYRAQGCPPNQFYMHSCSYYFAHHIKNDFLHNFELWGIKTLYPAHSPFNRINLCHLFNFKSNNKHKYIYRGV